MNSNNNVSFSRSRILLFQKQLKTSELFALVRKDLDTKDLHSIELSLVSCVKEVTLQNTMVQVENPSMVKNSLTKTSN